MFEGSVTLFGILAIVIAFSVVMLLLSVLVTALAQATQAIFRLRARNLQVGLAALLEHETDLSETDSRDAAATLLNSPEIAVLRRRRDPTSRMSRLRGPFVSWVEPEELRNTLDNAKDSDISYGSINVYSAIERFKRLDAPLSKRFATTMRIVAVSWALVVAFVFQVSSPQLLQQLSTDPEYRERLADRAAETLERGHRALGRLEVKEATDAALEELLRRHPELQASFQETFGDEAHPEAPVEDLAEILEDAPDRAALLAEFEELLSNEYRRRRDAALADARSAADELATIGITPWRYGGSFYWDGGPHLPNLLGVLLTAVLLSLGAPFWFNMLKTASGLRDLLAPRKKNSDKEESEDDSSDGEK